MRWNVSPIHNVREAWLYQSHQVGDQRTRRIRLTDDPWFRE